MLLLLFGLLKFVWEARSLTQAAIFSVHVTTSIRSDATVAAGTISNRSVSSSKTDILNRDLRVSAAAFELAMWVLTDDDLAIVLIADANSFKAFPVSELIIVYDS